MSKAFTKENDNADDLDDLEEANPIPAGAKNYMTPHGWRRMRDELTYLVKTERPAVTNVVSWAARNGDRSENAEVVDPATREETDQVFFAATVAYANAAGEETTVRIVGLDETDLGKGYISWISPVARALIKARDGDTVSLVTPGGREELEILEVRYEEIPMAPFVPAKSFWSPNAK